MFRGSPASLVRHPACFQLGEGVLRMDWPMGPGGGELHQAWTQSAADSLGWGILAWAMVVTGVVLLMVVMVPRVLRRRRFWCAEAEREVEVEFVEEGLMGFRRPVAVRTCSVFEPATAVQCRRRYLNRDVRVRLPMIPPREWRRS